MKLKKHMKKKIFYISIAIIVIAIIAFILLFTRNSTIKFTSDCNVEINSIVDYTKFVKDVQDGLADDIEIDSTGVDISKIGEYTVVYKYKDKTELLKVKVIDTTPPEFDVVNQSIALNQKINPKDCVTNIKDATKTEIAFKKDVSFHKEGTQEITVVVTDEANNATEKTVQINVKKDITPPIITASNENFVLGQDIDLKNLVKVTDDLDRQPKISFTQNNFDKNKIGSYQVEYVAKDASGNESKKTITIQIVKKTAANEKVVYLTFDDGPSKYTPEVLKILNKYNCDATFFITGMNAPYRKYIKEASNQGHTIGLHTYSHNYSKIYASTDAYFKDLEKVGSLAKDYLGYTPKYIRFPGGGSNAISKKYTKGIMTKLTKMVAEKGYIYYDWNAENGDGYNNMSKSEMYKRATSSKANQIMILMHDANGKQSTVDILPKVIEHYQSRGYVFKGIDDSTFVPHQRVNN